MKKRYRYCSILISAISPYFLSSSSFDRVATEMNEDSACIAVGENDHVVPICKSRRTRTVVRLSKIFWRRWKTDGKIGTDTGISGFCFKIGKTRRFRSMDSHDSIHNRSSSSEEISADISRFFADLVDPLGFECVADSRDEYRPAFTRF